MKNPLYPSKLIDATSIFNYNKCYIITLEKTPVVKIFDETIVDSSFSEYTNLIKENYKISLVPMWMIKSIIGYQKKFIMFELTEDELKRFEDYIWDDDGVSSARDELLLSAIEAVMKGEDND